LPRSIEEEVVAEVRAKKAAKN